MVKARRTPALGAQRKIDDDAEQNENNNEDEHLENYSITNMNFQNWTNGKWDKVPEGHVSTKGNVGTGTSNNRQRHRKFRSFAELASDGDGSAMKTDVRANDGKSEP